MNDTIIYAIAFSILGTVFSTVFPFIIKKLNKENIKFDLVYIMTLLIAAIISTALLPLYFYGSNLPVNNNAFICVSGFAIAAILNFVINTFVAHWINNINRLKELAGAAGDAISPSSDTKKILSICAIAFLIFGLSCTSVFAAVTVSRSLTGTGNITTTGNMTVYSDSGGATILTSINWGNVAPGSAITVPIWIKDSANYPLTLSMSVSGYTPTQMAQYLTITWTYVPGTVIQPGQMQKVDLTLTAAGNAVAGSFSNNLIITGTQSG